MKNNELFDETNEATYCPEDDKLRLYVGRVPREEYLSLKKEGWKSTPKQDCDFVAVWTPRREDTAIGYAGIVLDEDQSPTDRAADRAERFSEYREKRRAEAHGHADKYDAGPAVHGYQDSKKAERAAKRHDRQADRACDAWGKAEYWQRRTDGVIRSALYSSRPDVRMRRIKKIEAEIRKAEKACKQYDEERALWVKASEMQDEAKRAEYVRKLAGFCSYGVCYYRHPRPEECTNSYILEHGGSLYSLLTLAEGAIAEAEALEMYLLAHPERNDRESRFTTHRRLRLAYETQMLEAAGGRAGQLDMEVGGWVGKYQILKVNKSRATGRVVSVSVKAPLSNLYSYDREAGKYYGEDHPRPIVDTLIKVEDVEQGVYRAPTEADKEALKAIKKATPKKAKLINPTLEEAERLQARLNNGARIGKSEVLEMTQAAYSDSAKGGGRCRVIDFDFDGEKFRARAAWSCYQPYKVIVLTDKPQKELPSFNERKEIHELTAEELERVAHIMRPRSLGESSLLDRSEGLLLAKAEEAGLVRIGSATQRRWTEKGSELCPKVKV